MSLSSTLDELDLALADFQAKFSKFTESTPSLSTLPAEQSARTHLTLAFSVNSLFYSTLRLAQTDRPADVKQHPVHAQLKIVREHYVKLDNVINNRSMSIRSKEGQGNQVIKRIVERTDRENQRIIKQQNKEAEKAKKRSQSSSSSSSSSDSSESESEEEVKVPASSSVGNK